MQPVAGQEMRISVLQVHRTSLATTSMSLETDSHPTSPGKSLGGLTLDTLISASWDPKQTTPWSLPELLTYRSEGMMKWVLCEDTKLAVIREVAIGS